MFKEHFAEVAIISSGAFLGIVSAGCIVLSTMAAFAPESVKQTHQQQDHHSMAKVLAPPVGLPMSMIAPPPP